METGEDSNGRPRARLVIPRRSCDQCRTRKIACDRASPCSTCVSSRLNCTYSTVASNTKAPRQRVLISAEYEKKINDIWKGIDAIQTSLQTSRRPLIAQARNDDSSTSSFTQADEVKPGTQGPSLCAPGSDTQWDHSAHIIDFIRSFMEEIEPSYVGTVEDQVVSSLKTLLEKLEDPGHLIIPKATAPISENDSHMPPMAASVAILRWAQAHQSYATILRLSHVLPHEKFSDICQKVYFAVEDYNEIEFIIANGYLYYIFCEHAAGSGREDYREYSQLCEKNMFKAFKRLPLILPTSMEVVAALVLGALNAVENSKASLAWTFISTASTQCQALGYHRNPPTRANGAINTQRASQERLFWTVYRLDKGLSLRFGRASNISDYEVTLPFTHDLPKSVRLARIQGKVYEQLYSAAALSISNNDMRIHNAERLAEQLQSLINETYAELTDLGASQGSGTDPDPLHEYYLQSDLVCQSSLLTLILRAIPLPLDASNRSTSNYVTAARDVFDIHHRCMMSVQKHRSGPAMNKKYINWAILNTPFVPFTILFTRVVQFHDLIDLTRLKRFTDSLRLDQTISPSITHPYQLYDLLCQAAQLYMRTNALSLPDSLSSFSDSLLQHQQADFPNPNIEVEKEHGEVLEEASSHFDNLDEWFQGNQQLMTLLDENATF